MDFNNSPLLTIIKEEQDITIVKTEFDSNLDLYNVEKMDLEEDVNRADPFLGFNNNYQASMLKDHTKDINNQMYAVTALIVVINLQPNLWVQTLYSANLMEAGQKCIAN
ncbi:uncharacterized protein LOC126845592 isoform X3 [Adelges cooleyi]|uniref:uncharacterized protein LOC126845592 isoform X3 n=1 Tax=Adelges cooleyi TaxID=133065 RepID=UPI00217FFCE1|nr:uncharacterized protein LOC126845592 isoform X3 [Adelges cooleyi]